MSKDVRIAILGDASSFSRALGSAGRDADSAFDKIKGKAMVGGAALVAFGVSAFNASNEFNKSMANIGSLIPGNTERVGELKKSIQDLAISMGQSTGDMAGGMYQIVSAFGDGAEAVKLLEINARAGAGGMATVSEAIALTSAVTKGYGDTSALAVQKAADLAAVTVRLGQTTFPELAAAIGSVTPLSAALAVSQEELFAVMATATGVTGNASEVSTQFRGILQSLMSPTDDMAGLLKKMGVSSGEALIEQQGLSGALSAITAAAADSGKPLQDFITSIEGQTLALALTGGQADAFKSKLGEMAGAVGASDAAFKAQTEGVNAAGFQWEQLKVRATVALQTVGDKLGEFSVWLGTLGDEVSGVREYFDRLSKSPLVDFLIGLVVAFARLVTEGIDLVAGPLSALVGFLRDNEDVVKALAVGIGVVLLPAFLAWAAGAAMATVSMIALGIAAAAAWVMATLPIALLVLAIAALAYAVIRNFDTIKSTISGVIDWLGDTWPVVLEILKDPIGLFVLAIVKNWDEIKETVAAAWGAIEGAAATAWSGIQGLITGFVGTIKDIIMELPAEALEAGGKIVHGLWDGINAAKDWLMGKVKAFGKSIFNAVKDGLGTLWPFSPSEAGVAVGEGFGLGMMKGLSDITPKLTSNLKQFGAFSVAAVTPVMDFAKTGSPGAGSPGSGSPGAVGSGGPTNITINLDGKQIARYIWDEHGLTSQMARAS